MDDPAARHDQPGRGDHRGLARVQRAGLPPHPGGQRHGARRHRDDAGPHAGVAAATHARRRHRRPPGLEGRGRHRDRGRRRPWVRGLLPLPPVLGRGAGRATSARGRLVPHVRGRAPDEGAARDLSSGGGAAAGRARRRPSPAPRHRRGRRLTARWPAHGRLAHRCRRRVQAQHRHRPHRAPGQRPADLCRRADDPHRPPSHHAGRGARRAPRIAGLRRELPLHDDGRGTRPEAGAGHRAVPDLHRRPRVQRARPSPLASSRRPAPISPPP